MGLMIRIMRSVLWLVFILFMAVLPASLYLYFNGFAVVDPEIFTALIVLGNVTGIIGIFISEYKPVEADEQTNK